MIEDSTILKQEQKATLHGFLSYLSSAVQCAALATEDIGLGPPLPPLIVPSAERDDSASLSGFRVHFPFPYPERIGFGRDSTLVIRIHPLFWSHDNVDALTWLKAELREQGLDRAHVDNEIHLDLTTYIDNFDVLRHYLLDFPELDANARDQMEDTLDRTISTVRRILDSRPLPPYRVLNSQPSGISHLN